MPRHLLLVLGGKAAVGALVQTVPPVRAQVLLQHQLVGTGELAAVAPEGLVLRGALLVRAQEVQRQQPSGLCGDGAQMTPITGLRLLCGALGPSPLALRLRRVNAPAVVP